MLTSKQRAAQAISLIAARMEGHASFGKDARHSVNHIDRRREIENVRDGLASDTSFALDLRHAQRADKIPTPELDQVLTALNKAKSGLREEALGLDTQARGTSIFDDFRVYREERFPSARAAFDEARVHLETGEAELAPITAKIERLGNQGDESVKLSEVAELPGLLAQADFASRRIEILSGRFLAARAAMSGICGEFTDLVARLNFVDPDVGGAIQDFRHWQSLAFDREAANRAAEVASAIERLTKALAATS
jgi:hypothetical protein